MSIRQIKKAVELLRQGELVAIPTETVYGLAADARNPEAIRKLFKIKGRPKSRSLLVNIYDVSEIKQWAKNIPDVAYELIDKFWPGPLTLILPARKNVSPLITGGKETIGLRMPSHPIARKLLKAFGGALVAPSANRFGHPSPKSAKAVYAEFGDKIPLILDGGKTKFGIESTILDLTAKTPKILRKGAISEGSLKKTLRLL